MVDLIPRVPRATHGSPDSPLRIGNIEIPCYVLDNGTRLITQSGVLNAIHMKNRGGRNNQRYRLARFVSGKSLQPFVSQDLLHCTQHPMLFTTPVSPQIALGYAAPILVDLVCAVVDAGDAGALRAVQYHIVEQCRILLKAFAKVGIIALVDEATGYQKDREAQDLHRLLGLILRDEFARWSKRFPDEFYRQMFRLRRWPYDIHKGPRKAGELTYDCIYAKLPAGVVQQLRARNPDDDNNRRKQKLHQWLTDDLGHKLLDRLMHTNLTLMQISETWDEFMLRLHKVVPTPEALEQLGIVA